MFRTQIAKMRYLLLSLVVVLVGCSSDDDPKPSPDLAKRTVLVYIMGDNSLSSLVDADWNEILEGAKSVDLKQNNLLVYYDKGYNSAQLRYLTKNKKGEVIHEVIQDYGENRNSVGLNEMKEVLSFVYTEYPANGYGIVLWSHADGWKPGTGSGTRWMGQDGENKMSIPDLSKALDAIPYYDFILFDACFMQSVEVAYELRDHTEYFIGSPAEIPGPGAPYQKVVPAFFTESNTAINIAQSYFDYYAKKYDESKQNSNANWTAGVAISVIKSEALNELAAATSKIISTIDDVAGIDRAGLLNYDFRSSYNSEYIGYFDMDILIESLASNYDEYTSWKEKYDVAVPYGKATDKIFSGYTQSTHSISGYTGVSCYIPNSARNPAYESAYKEFGWYTAGGWSQTGW